MNNDYANKILLGICDKLQLSQTLYEQATQRYETIADILQKDKSFNNIDLKMYPQGSFRLKTTVKPLNEEEYDLDFVVQLPEHTQMSPRELYANIVRILENDGIHKNMVEQKKRCIRINYANDFHLDIMPGKLINSNTNEIIVPDKELRGWYHHSNPIGFADWFEFQARSHIKYELNEMYRMQASIEKVTEQEITKHLEPLRKAVQLAKRYRDIYCDKTGVEPVRSIVICTLMGQISRFTGSTLQILQGFCSYVNNLIQQNDYKPFKIKNPVVNEILTEKWNEGNNFKDFVSMVTSLTNDVNKLQGYTINTDSNKLVKKMFGESITNDAITEYAKIINKAREDNLLSVTSNGALSLNQSGVSVKKNTFYGI